MNLADVGLVTPFSLNRDFPNWEAGRAWRRPLPAVRFVRPRRPALAEYQVGWPGGPLQSSSYLMLIETQWGTPARKGVTVPSPRGDSYTAAQLVDILFSASRSLTTSLLTSFSVQGETRVGGGK